MKTSIFIIIVSLTLSCSPKKPSESMKNYDTIPGTFAYDRAFLNQNGIKSLVLSDSSGQSQILIIPGWQARVMTSSASGDSGFSYGWINYNLISSGGLTPHMNAFGGEERLWLGPEGGPYSIYFAPGVKQEFNNWFVPGELDTAGFEIMSQAETRAVFKKSFSLVNYSGTKLDVEIQRTVSLIDRSDLAALLGIELPRQVKCVAYQSDNRLINKGNTEWNKANGMLSIWMLSMLNPSPGVTIFIPYDKNVSGPVVNDDYFGKVPGDRLLVRDGFIWFKADGKYRSKIGIPPSVANEYAASYDSQNGILTLLRIDIPTDNEIYVNSKWGEQKDPFSGDVINAYNDGPVEDGTQMGPFYELESSSPAALLNKGESILHTQRICHFKGDTGALSLITMKLFGLTIDEISRMFN